ncbi:MAG: GGDEF domain-containing protein [Dehalococcoidia bacterium]|nr:GGDEF domain-containing protein [Dehalococcoidia bacterium]
MAAATIDGSGQLVHANAGFRRLAGLDSMPETGARVDQLFLQPTFQKLQDMPEDAEGMIFQGLLTLGEASGRSRTLRGRVWRKDHCVRLLAEHHIEDLERLNDTVLQLNEDYASAQVQLSQANFKLQQREAQILEASLTDQLTGVANRRRLELAITVEIERAQRTGNPLSAIMADLDYFKHVNDTYGHDVGDKVLTSFGALLRGQTRSTDIVARFGGEEFVVLMPETRVAPATEVAERIRRELGNLQVQPIREPLSASFGVAELVAGETVRSS